MEKAFSLVELSIVLVILGLLVGGIMTGQNLIRAAELRSISTEVANLTTATNTFRDKYFALPGDMTNATAFWDAQDGNDGLGADCTNLDQSNPATGTATCNGNGNGRIAGGWANVTDASQYELFRAWHHLANAGMIEGSYAGVTDSTINVYTSGPGATPGWNLPVSKVAQAGYLFTYWGTDPHAAGTNIMLGNYGHVIVFGNSAGASMYHNYNYAPTITPEEAWNIDTKMDDGKPGTGNVMTPGTGVNPDCAGDNTPAATYVLTETAQKCALIFKTGF